MPPLAAPPAPANAPPARPRPAPSIAALMLRAFSLPLLLLIGVAAAVIAGVEQNARSAALVTAAQTRLTLIEAIAEDVSELENGQRGFVITGDETFLQPYERGRLALEDDLRELEARSVTDLQRRNIGRIRALTRAWNERAGQPEIAARRSSLEGAAALVEGSDGRRLLEEARSVLGEMRTNENARLRAAVAASTATLSRVQLLTVAGLLLSTALLILAALRTAHTLSRSAAQLMVGAEAIAAGEYGARLPPLPLRELNELGGQFHRMADAVQSRERALEEAGQALRASNEELSRSNRELEQFAYVASHDLQEPLRTISSYTELLARRYHGQLDARADQYIGFTTAATARLKNLIQDLLAYSRVRQSQRPLTEVDTAALVEGVIQDLHAEVEASGATVERGPLPTVQANPDLLRHIFLNLLGNALKFRAEGRPPQVRVWAEPEVGRREDGGAAGWAFHVQDNGIGIEPQYFERIFGVFQRLHGMDEFPGSGIGLAVARTAAERHGGQFRVQSTPGAGSTFTFTLPPPTRPPPGPQETSPP
ncbi:sensor histidine kinase [Deinococcus budaensis]|uniref:histidine kinase n=1 Tax=Deinococcus budaensis TaxID=1665626 RepID=A0A7W8LPZ5_9DEIO|nr:ATP-binding protein [Deinococcus budaensis]MBB5234065.1 signal transduction histidine kinase [Deinococcus budaensis]